MGCDLIDNEGVLVLVCSVVFFIIRIYHDLIEIYPDLIESKFVDQMTPENPCYEQEDEDLKNTVRN